MIPRINQIWIIFGITALVSQVCGVLDKQIHMAPPVPGLPENTDPTEPTTTIKVAPGQVLLSNSYLPAVMQAIAYYVELIQYEPLQTTTIEPPYTVAGMEVSVQKEEYTQRPMYPTTTRPTWYTTTTRPTTRPTWYTTTTRPTTRPTWYTTTTRPTTRPTWYTTTTRPTTRPTTWPAWSSTTTTRPTTWPTWSSTTTTRPTTRPTTPPTTTTTPPPTTTTTTTTTTRTPTTTTTVRSTSRPTYQTSTQTQSSTTRTTPIPWYLDQTTSAHNPGNFQPANPVYDYPEQSHRPTHKPQTGNLPLLSISQSQFFDWFLQMKTKQLSDLSEYDLQFLHQLPSGLLQDILYERYEQPALLDKDNVNEFLKVYDDFYGRNQPVTGRKKIPPTKPYVQLLMLYDILKREAKKLMLNKFEGYSPEMLEELNKTTQGSAERQLHTLLYRMITRKDVDKPDVVVRVTAIIEDLINPESTLAMSMRYIPPLAFVP